ncbi:hypothetical protein [Bradyrhizobium sp.]|uniref:hypothetical protein n=1 Tax=Bradyrhizobium sp. TaxID=376 RepID=UPI0040377094
MTTMMQPAIERLVQTGPLPSSNAATVPMLQDFKALLAQVQTPITDNEARALVQLFGPDDCFGLAWSLLHLIETAPGWPVADALHGLDGQWIDRLRERASSA